MIKSFLTTALLSCLPLVACAQPACNPALPNTVQCQSAAVNLQPTDLLAGVQATGPQRSNQLVGVPVSQVLNVPGSTQYVPYSGLTTSTVGHLAILRSANMTVLTSQPMTMTVPSGPYLVTAAYATNCNNSPAGAQGNIYRTPTRIASILNGTQTYNSLPYPSSVEQFTLSVSAVSLTASQFYFWLSSGAPTAGTTCDVFVDGIGL